MLDPINWQLVLPYYVLALAGGYLCGSIPFGLLITRWGGMGDIRSIGSGNIGATNVLRTGRKDLAALTLLFDALKGAAPVLVAAQFSADLPILAGAGAFLGHLFPVWLRFKGGKGVAVAFGVLLALSWQCGLLALATWLITAVLTRTSSLAALYTAALAPFYFWLLAPTAAEMVSLMAVVVWLSHRANIARLWAGTEPRIGGRGGAAPTNGAPTHGTPAHGSGTGSSATSSQ